MAETRQNAPATKAAGYETTLITRSEMSDEALKALQARLAEVISSYEGEIVLTEDWGKRKLAYPIRKESRGHYNYFVYSGKGDIVHELERNLRLNDQVLRFLTVNLAQEFDAPAFKKTRSEIHAAAKRREEEREARREERAERRSYHDDRRHDSSDDRRHDSDDSDDSSS